MKTNLFNIKFPSFGGVRGGFKLPPLWRGLGGGLLLLTATAHCLLFAVGCNKNDDNNNPPDGQGSITLTVATHYGYKIEFGVTAQQLTIDWGDGSTAETYTDITAQISNGIYPYLSPNIIHTYPGSGTYTVQIKGEGLTHFSCDDEKDIAEVEVTSLDVSKCPTLEWLDCCDNESNSLDVSKCPALQYLSCSYNQLASLDVSKCTALKLLDCHGNQLTTLDVSKCPALQTLYCDFNQLNTLDVSKCPALQLLWCGNNQLTSLDVSKCPALKELDCGNFIYETDYPYNNRITSLDISKCPALEDLTCDHNQLTSLDVSKCPALQHLRLWDNQLSAAALNSVFTALPTYTGEEYGIIVIDGNPGQGACNKAIAENKGWKVWY